MLPSRPSGNACLNGVGDQFIDDKAARNSTVQVRSISSTSATTSTRWLAQAVGADQLGAKTLNVRPHGNFGEIPGAVEVFVHQGH